MVAILELARAGLTKASFANFAVVQLYAGAARIFGPRALRWIQRIGRTGWIRNALCIVRIGSGAVGVATTLQIAFLYDGEIVGRAFCRKVQHRLRQCSIS